MINNLKINKVMNNVKIVKDYDEFKKVYCVFMEEPFYESWTNSDMEEEYAYCIVLDYYDENHDEKRIYKHGYGEYPDNWSKIVADINEVTENTGNLSDSTDLVTIDADYLRANSKFDLHEDTYPDGVTLEDVIANILLHIMMCMAMDIR